MLFGCDQHSIAQNKVKFACFGGQFGTIIFISSFFSLLSLFITFPLSNNMQEDNITVFQESGVLPSVFCKYDWPSTTIQNYRRKSEMTILKIVKIAFRPSMNNFLRCIGEFGVVLVQR